MVNYFNFYLKFSATTGSTLVVIVAIVVICEGITAG